MLRTFFENQVKNDWKEILINYIPKDIPVRPFYPPINKLFRAYHLCPLKETRVVIIGEEPYCSIDPMTGIPHADGLAFSVPNEVVKTPRSLRRVIHAMHPTRNRKSLDDLTSQGVLLLNSSLTVGMEHSTHFSLWSPLIEKTVKTIIDSKKEVYFLLWGRKAWEFESLIPFHHYWVIKTNHPASSLPFDPKFDQIPFVDWSGRKI